METASMNTLIDDFNALPIEDKDDRIPNTDYRIQTKKYERPNPSRMRHCLSAVTETVIVLHREIRTHVCNEQDVHFDGEAT